MAVCDKISGKKQYKHTAKMTKLSGQLKDLVWQVVTIWLEGLEDGRPLKRVPSRDQSCLNIFHNSESLAQPPLLQKQTVADIARTIL